MALLKATEIPPEQRKKTTLANVFHYEALEIHDSKVVGFIGGQPNRVWYFKDFIGVDFVKANMNSQFAQIVFLTGLNSKNKVAGPDIFAIQNANAVNDTNRILFCSGMFSHERTNTFAEKIACEMQEAFERYRDNAENAAAQSAVASAADEIKKFKELLDCGAISQEEFNLKKRQLLNL